MNKSHLVLNSRGKCSTAESSQVQLLLVHCCFFRGAFDEEKMWNSQPRITYLCGCRSLFALYCGLFLSCKYLSTTLPRRYASSANLGPKTMDVKLSRDFCWNTFSCSSTPGLHMSHLRFWLFMAAVTNPGSQDPAGLRGFLDAKQLN